MYCIFTQFEMENNGFGKMIALLLLQNKSVEARILNVVSHLPTLCVLAQFVLVEFMNYDFMSLKLQEK